MATSGDTWTVFVLGFLFVVAVDDDLADSVAKGADIAADGTCRMLPEKGLVVDTAKVEHSAGFELGRQVVMMDVVVSKDTTAGVNTGVETLAKTVDGLVTDTEEFSLTVLRRFAGLPVY